MSEEVRKFIARNRKARHNYEIVDTYEAGLVLVGTEVKSLRLGKAQLTDSYATIEEGELWLHHLHISPYAQGNIQNHDPTRKRKLLLHRRELHKLKTRLEERGYTLVPLSIYFKGKVAKIELGLGRGKKAHDKRQAIGEREAQREIDRRLKERHR
ncbi:MAG: SsrA-binding protein SmpB [bacterium]